MKPNVVNETTAGSISAVNAPLGGGDPAASIYPPQKKKKKKTKMIRRPAMEKKQMVQVQESVLDDKDDDGFMAKRQLYDIAKYAIELHKTIQDTDDLDPWIQEKLTLANDYISSVQHHLSYNEVDSAADLASEVGMNDIAEPVDTLPLSQPDLGQVDLPEPLEEFEEAEPSEFDEYDVLHWAHIRQIISQEQYDDPIPALEDAAADVAMSIMPQEDIGSSDVSIFMRDLVRILRQNKIPMYGEKAHLYESEVKARHIYNDMIKELKEGCGKTHKKKTDESQWKHKKKNTYSFALEDEEDEDENKSVSERTENAKRWDIRESKTAHRPIKEGTERV